MAKWGIEPMHYILLVMPLILNTSRQFYKGTESKKNKHLITMRKRFTHILVSINLKSVIDTFGWHNKFTVMDK